MINIALILGSVREGRKTNRVATHLMELLAAEEQVAPVLLDLMEYQLPVFANRWAQDPRPNPAIVDFSTALAEADALIFLSPEYHGSYSGALKNALDHFWEEFRRKPIGVVTTGSGRFGGINASSEMQQLILSLGAFPMPKKLLVPHIQHAFDEDGKPLDERTAQEAADFTREFLWFARAIQHAKEGASLEKQGHSSSN